MSTHVRSTMYTIFTLDNSIHIVTIRLILIFTAVGSIRPKLIFYLSSMETKHFVIFCLIYPVDTPKLRQMDINYALTVILNVLSPPAKLSSSHQNSSTKSAMHHLSISEHGRCSSFSHTNKNPVKYQGNELLISTAYLGKSCY